MAELTPMMKQYMSIKDEHKDEILFYRIGDFYEMFFEDAVIASRELELVLTGKDCGLEERAPMCGIPYHACEPYIARLVARGYKVAICEQLSDPKLSKGLVERDIIRIVTPGTVTEASMLEEAKNNYIMAVCLIDDIAGLAFADVSTGELLATDTNDKAAVVEEILNEAGRYSPKEVLLNASAAINGELVSKLKERLGCIVTTYDSDDFSGDKATAEIEGRFGKNYAVKSGLDTVVGGVSAVGALLKYLEDMQRTELANISDVHTYKSNCFMQLDINTRRNLELCETMRKGEKRGSLLWVLDKTKTSMGGRLIRKWIEKPLCSIGEINSRLNAVKIFYDDNTLREGINTSLKEIYDIERIVSRVALKTVNCRDLKALERTAQMLPPIIQMLCGIDSPMISRICGDIDPLEDICALLESAIVDEPPLIIRDGGIIKDGFDASVDELNHLVKDSKSVLADIENKERERTGIKNLRISYNKVFGYFIEVTNSYKDLVPQEYIRKQTLTNCERYITQELKTLEEKILSAKEKVVALEYDLFINIRQEVEKATDRIQRTANALATLDVINAFAEVSKANRFVKPDITTDGTINIKDGRHPVVEQMLKDSLFVPNDTLLDKDENRLAIITGPNMAGKSTYMRQVAVIVLMAQMGCFVPAADATISVVDKIFTRVGASDDLSAGQSTFMVEMSEVAYILGNATRDSLLILDEIGRGTSTYDGMSIARAVLEYCANKKKLGAKTLFATHYHELTELENELDGVKNYNIAVKKRGDDITFLRRIIRGGADDSYGIEVAKLAGIPQNVIDRAKEVLKMIDDGASIQIAPRIAQACDDDGQISLSSGVRDEFVRKITNLEIDTLTPIESMNLLYKLKEEAKGL